MRKITTVLVGAYALLACTPQYEAQGAIKQLLNDPDSAKFTVLTDGPDGNVCGMVNAKNRMGGYVGPMPFFYQANGKYAAIVPPPDEGDFRSLWLSIKIRSSFADEFAKLSMRCKRVSEWKSICGTAYPLSTHRLCSVMTQEGGAMYNALKSEFD